MAEKLTEFEFPTRAPRASKYDWDTFLDGGIYKLVEGTDYTAKPEAVLQSARHYADIAGKKVKSAVGEGFIVVQAIEKPVEVEDTDEETEDLTNVA